MNCLFKYHFQKAIKRFYSRGYKYVPIGKRGNDAVWQENVHMWFAIQFLGTASMDTRRAAPQTAHLASTIVPSKKLTEALKYHLGPKEDSDQRCLYKMSVNLLNLIRWYKHTVHWAQRALLTYHFKHIKFIHWVAWLCHWDPWTFTHPSEPKEKRGSSHWKKVKITPACLQLRLLSVKQMWWQ